TAHRAALAGRGRHEAAGRETEKSGASEEARRVFAPQALHVAEDVGQRAVADRFGEARETVAHFAGVAPDHRVGVLLDLVGDATDGRGDAFYLVGGVVLAALGVTGGSVARVLEVTAGGFGDAVQVLLCLAPEVGKVSLGSLPGG